MKTSRGLTLGTAFLSLVLLRNAPAATFVWNGSGGDGNWSTAANWAGNAVPDNHGTALIVLAGASQLTPNVDAAWDISALVFTNNAGPFVLGGSALNLRAGGVTNVSANAQIINNAITLTANQTWYATSNTLTFNGNINIGTSLLSITGSSNSFFNGILSGSGGLAKTGTGTNTLAGANTYSGLTTISTGAMSLQNSAALGSPSAGTIVASGATLQLQGGMAGFLWPMNS